MEFDFDPGSGALSGLIPEVAAFANQAIESSFKNRGQEIRIGPLIIFEPRSVIRIQIEVRNGRREVQCSAIDRRSAGRELGFNFP
jgi:hypothetical protein